MTFGAAAGLRPGAIVDIHRDRSGRLWLASERAGLIRVDRPESEHPAFVAYTTAQGLSSDSIEVITEDRNGFLYVSRGQGLDRFDPATGRVKHFTGADGLAPGPLYAAFTDRNGVLWFGSSNGLVRFAPKSERPPVAPVALISAVRVGGVSQFISALGERSMSFPALETDRNQLQIDFVTLGFSLGEVLRYQYKLEGAAGDWSAPSEQRTVNYASLAPGRYTFRVRALNSDGLVSVEPATIAFTILRPIWLRWWFLTAVGLVIAAALYAVYQYRIARVLELASMRTRIATDLHDDIGANLTRIALLSEVAQRVPDGAPLASIARIARESVAAMSDIVWAINPKRESLADLLRRMRRHAEDVFTLRDIDLQFHTPDAEDTLRLSMDVRRDLLLVFKEAVNNTARHAHCSHVSIDLHRDGSHLVLSVADNGVGFDPAQESAGQGLASLRRRARQLKGTLDVQSRPLAGTTVTLQIPL
jgi:signal transduction histidine kinase